MPYVYIHGLHYMWMTLYTVLMYIYSCAVYIYTYMVYTICESFYIQYVYIYSACLIYTHMVHTIYKWLYTQYICIYSVCAMYTWSTSYINDFVYSTYVYIYSVCCKNTYKVWTVRKRHYHTQQRRVHTQLGRVCTHQNCTHQNRDFSTPESIDYTHIKDKYSHAKRALSQKAQWDVFYGVAAIVGSLKLKVSFAEYRLFYRALLQKRPIMLRSLLIVATPYINIRGVHSFETTAKIRSLFCRISSLLQGSFETTRAL